MTLHSDDVTIDDHLLSLIAEGRLIVIGDLILDHYVTGRVERISPEAPVPVLNVVSEHYVPGGAANVAANIAALGGEVVLIGVTGQDANAATLAEELSGRCGLSLSLISTKTRPTPTKTRYLGNMQQVVRVDREMSKALSVEVREQLLGAVDEALAKGARTVVMSDYAKGTFSDGFAAQVIARGQAAGVPVIVDPKARDLSIYAGASVITPNRKELQEATGVPCGTDDEIVAAGAAAIEISGADILVTRSEQGISYISADRKPIHMPTEARRVFDVSGAGDTTIAAFSLCIASGIGLPQAIRVANIAAGVAVAKRGTAIITADEVAEILRRRRLAHAPFELLTDADALVARCAGWQKEGLTIGFANGCFDLIHPGHIRLIHAAAASCDRLVIALNSDASVRRLKGPSRPLQDETARAEVMSAIKGVDALTFFDEDTPMELIKKIVPDVIIKGADYTEEQVVGADFIKARGGRVLLVELKDGHSTTNLAAKFGKV